MAIIIFKLSLAEKLPTTPTPSDTHTHTHTCAHPHPQAHTHTPNPNLPEKKESFHLTSTMRMNGGRKEGNLWKY